MERRHAQYKTYLPWLLNLYFEAHLFVGGRLRRSAFKSKIDALAGLPTSKNMAERKDIIDAIILKK